MIKIPINRLIHLDNQNIEFNHTLDFSYLKKRHLQLVDIEPVHFIGEGYKEAKLFVVRGQLSGSFLLQCSRCLDTYQHSFKQNVLERFDLQSALNHYTDEEDREDEIHPIEGHELNLMPYLEEHVQMLIPFVPSCHDETACRQRMVTAGKDWNYLEQQHQDDQNQIDPRLAKLARFFDDHDA